MPNYFYKAKDKKNEYVEGIVQAPNEDLAADILIDKGLVILWIKTAGTGIGAKTSKFFQRVSTKDLVLFSRELSILIQANVPLVQALRILVQQTKNKNFKLIISEIGDDVEGGTKLSTALSRHDHAFSNFFVSIVRSGETSGKLDEVLVYLADQQEKDYDLVSKIRSAMIYPVFILVGLLTVGIIMMVFVVPKMTGILEEVGAELPITTKILIGVSKFLQSYWILLIIGLVVSFGVFRVFIQTKTGRKVWDTVKIRAPIFGKLTQKIIVVRMARGLRTLIEGGVPITQSLRITSEIVDNAVFEEIIQETIGEVEDGNPIATVFSKREEFPLMVSQMLNIGEKTGRMDQILEKIGDFYSREIDALVKGLVTLIEPLTIVLIGIGVGMMIAAVILPIYNLSGSL